MSTEPTVTRFTGVERLLHLVYLLAFLGSVGTGLVLFLPQLRALAVGPAGEWDRLIHRLAAVVLMATPVAYFWFGRERMRESLRWILTWTKADREWMGPGLRFYWTGERAGIPAQGKFNTGQKGHAALQGVSFAIFVVTGLLLWSWGWGVPAWLFRVSVILHDVAFLCSVGGFLLHFYLAVIHPHTREHLGAMVHGAIPEEDAKALYTLWYERLRRGSGEG